MPRFSRIGPAMLALVILTGAMAQAPDEFDDETRAAAVNEGELEFLGANADPTVLHSESELWLTPNSLEDGWAELRQCYRNLDAVSKTELVYAYRDMRGLRITRQENITRSRVRQQVVELEEVGRGASICIEAEVDVLRRVSAASYLLRNGPYHRRFLDGYYPYRVSLEVIYPHRNLRILRVSPAAQAGFDLVETPGRLHIDAWFEGRLTIEIEFGAAD